MEMLQGWGWGCCEDEDGLLWGRGCCKVGDAAEMGMVML